MTVKTRMMCFRLALAVIWIGLGIVLFLMYRGHTLLIDNKDLEDGSRAPELISVSLDNGKAVSFMRGDRDRVTVTGPKHRIRIEGGGGAPFERSFTLPVKHDTYLLSIPKMTGGIQPFIEPFVAQPDTRNREEEEPLETQEPAP